jgi:hypothetical protein
MTGQQALSGVLLLLALACGDDDGGETAQDGSPSFDGSTSADVPGGGVDAEVASFGEAVDRFVMTLCIDAAVCTGDDQISCEDDALADLGHAMVVLDDAGEQQCIACLDAKVEELEEWIDDDCNEDAVDQDNIVEACDLDPTTDYDGDGTADNDDDEACAGFP